MRAGEPARRAGREPTLVEQVDREPLGADELPELLGRGLERVLERELLVRLADDREERARLHELCLDAGGSPARSERVCRARREVAEVLDEVGARNQLGREHELEQAEGRFAELLRDRPAGAELQDADRRRAPAPVGGPHRGVELGGAVQTQPPQGDPLGAGELEGEAQDVRRAVRRVGAGGERVRGDAKRGLRPAVLPLLRAERARGEADLRRDQPCCGSGALVEVARDPEQLDAPVHLAAHDDGHDERTLRSQSLGQTGHRLRRLAEPDLARGQVVERQSPTLELDRERRRGACDRPHDEVTAVLVDDPREDDVGTRQARRGTDDRPQDVSEPASPCGGSAGVRERFQRPRIESGPLAPLRLHCHPALAQYASAPAQVANPAPRPL